MSAPAAWCQPAVHGACSSLSGDSGKISSMLMIAQVHEMSAFAASQHEPRGTCGISDLRALPPSEALMKSFTVTMTPPLPPPLLPPLLRVMLLSEADRCRPPDCCPGGRLSAISGRDSCSAADLQSSRA